MKKIIRLFRNLLFKILQRLNDYEISKLEIRWAINKITPHLDKDEKILGDRIIIGMFLYSATEDMELVAEELEISRERVRQYLFKVVRVAHDIDRKEGSI